MSRSAPGLRVERQGPLWGLAVVSLAWLLVAILSGLPGLPAWLAGPVSAIGSGGAVFPPILVLLLIAAFVPFGGRDPDVAALEARVATAMQTAGQLEQQLGRIDATLGDCARKVDALGDAASRKGDGLVASAESMEVAAGTMVLASGDMGKAVAALSDLVPTLTAQARDADSLLRTAGGQATLQIQSVDGALAAIAARSTDAGIQAETSIAAMQKLLAQIDATSTETTKAIANRAYTLDAAVTGVLDRSASAFASIGETLREYSGRFEVMIAGVRQDIDDFGSEGTRAIGQRLDVLLGAANQLKQQFHDHQALSDQVQARAMGNFAEVEARLGTLREAQAAAGEAVGAGIDAGVEALERRLAALRDAQESAAEAARGRAEAASAALMAQAAELQAGQAEAARAAEAGGRQLVETMDARLAQLRVRQAEAMQAVARDAAADMGEIEARLGLLSERQRAATAELGAEAAAGVSAAEGRLAELRERQLELSRSFGVQLAEGMAALDSELAGLRQSAEGRLAESRARVAETLADVGLLGDALAERQATTAALRTEIGTLRPMLDDVAADAEERLPAIGAAIDGVSDRSRSMLGELEQMRERIESQAALLRDSAAAFERDHASIVGLSEMLAGHFTEARAIVGDIHASTEQTAIAAASRMVENVVQVRQSVNATSAEIRALLAEVVAEAEKALDEFASTKAEQNFGAPIRLQIAALEDAAGRASEAASAASERVSVRLVELMRTVAETEARVDEVDTRMDVRARDTLVARSMRLIDSLTAESIDVARLLAVDVGDTAWDRYLKGDRSLFARTTVRLADKETARKIARHFAHDEPFREEAARYCDQFEMLIRRVLKDPDGDAFALVLLSSDIGKLYVLIAQAIGRPIARRED